MTRLSRELEQEYDGMFCKDNVSLVEFYEGGKRMFWPWRRHVESILFYSFHIFIYGATRSKN